MSFNVVLGGMFGVLRCVHVVAVSQVSVVGCRFMVAFAVMARGFAVVARSVLVMFRCLGVMMHCVMRHGEFLSTSVCLRHGRNYGDCAECRGYRTANST